MIAAVSELPKGRGRLTEVLKASGDTVDIDIVVDVLGIERTQASKQLSRWVEQGWMRRVGSGVYVPVDLDLQGSEQVVEEPWVLVPALFNPCYIGGRTAAEHWDLTEQFFNDVLVYTARDVRGTTTKRQGILFTLKRVQETALFGLKTVWRGRSAIKISDPHRTVVDMLDDPSASGGIQHIDDCIAAYLRRPDADISRVIEYAARLGNGAVFKRLGFLAERRGVSEAMLSSIKDRMTKGYAALDPALDDSRLVTRWRLRVPETWLSEAAS